MSRRTSGTAVAVRAMRGMPGKCFRSVSSLAVLGPEVVAPLRDTVRLVDRDQPDRGMGERREEACLHALLGRDEEEPEAAVREALFEPGPVAVVEGAVPGRGRDAPGVQVVDLVLHQRDQGEMTSVRPPRYRAGSW